MTATLTAPVLTDGVVTLRARTSGDVQDMVALGRDPESARWTIVPQPDGEADAWEWIAEVERGWREVTAFRWAIEARDGGRPRLAGGVDVRLGPPPDLGYALAPWARGQGLAARAVRLATGWAFDPAGLPVVHWSARAGNLASWRVAHACGFTFAGERPLAIAHRGELRDGWFAWLRPTTRPRRAPRDGPPRFSTATASACARTPTYPGSSRPAPMRARVAGPPASRTPAPTTIGSPRWAPRSATGHTRMRAAGW